MRFLSTILLSFLTVGVRADIVYYLDPPLNGNFTLINNLNNGVVTFGPGADGIVEVQPNASHEWLFERFHESFYIVRDSSSPRFLYFPDANPGAIATVSETAASPVQVIIRNDAIIQLRGFEGFDGWFTSESYSSDNPNRKVLRLRRVSGVPQQDFIVVKRPGNGH